uniref:Radical SAM protein n=1 Tax=candidate division WOR-3 bacterium TaxID=2052148 RepID=A0A7C3Z008_UNCW3
MARDRQEKELKYLYGPVFSWRLGISLGIDPISGREKTCSFNCIYCQLGETKNLTCERKIYVPTDEVVKEIISLPQIKIDYITFSGRGEPTLAKNLKEMFEIIKKLRNEKIAVITNSSLLFRDDVIEDLLLADSVLVKLDAGSQKLLETINRPVKGLTFNLILDGIKRFRKAYKNKFALQVMFVLANKNYAKDLAQLAREIGPDEIQINTPLRPCKVKPLPKKEIDKIKEYFRDMNYISVYDVEKKEVKPFSKKDTLKRRGKM